MGQRRYVAAALVAAVVATGPAIVAHHSHPDFDLTHRVTVEGTLQTITLQNPHSILTLRADDGNLYTVEWQGMYYLEQPIFVLPIAASVTRDTLHAGDRLVVTAFAAKDPTHHELVVVVDLSRPADGWRWTCDIPERRMVCGR